MTHIRKIGVYTVPVFGTTQAVDRVAQEGIAHERTGQEGIAHERTGQEGIAHERADS
jgi:hypothetical protein